MTDRARDITDHNAQHGRDTPPSEDNFTPPDQASDPHSQEDETTPSLRDRVTKNWFRLIGVSFLLMAGLGFAVFLLVTVAPGLLTNPLVQAAIAITTYTLLVYRAGGKRWLSIIDNHTIMVESRPNGPKIWLMEYDRATNTGRPVKGVSLWRGAKDNYSVRDLGGQHAQHIEKYGGDADDDAVIKYPESATVAETWLGTIGVCLTRGHRPTGGRQDIHLVAKPAERGHLSDLEDFAKELEQRDRLLEEKKDELQSVKANRDKYKRLYTEERDDVRAEIQEDMIIAHNATRNDQRRQQQAQDNSRDSIDELEAISENSKYGGSR